MSEIKPYITIVRHFPAIAINYDISNNSLIDRTKLAFVHPRLLTCDDDLNPEFRNFHQVVLAVAKINQPSLSNYIGEFAKQWGFRAAKLIHLLTLIKALPDEKFPQLLVALGSIGTDDNQDRVSPYVIDEAKGRILGVSWHDEP